VRGHSDCLFLHECKELDSAGLDDGLRVHGDLRPAAAFLGERNSLAAQQPDTTRAKAGENCPPGGPVLYERGPPDVLKGFSYDRW
jgi:hypothetical protein